MRIETEEAGTKNPSKTEVLNFTVRNLVS